MSTTSDDMRSHTSGSPRSVQVDHGADVIDVSDGGTRSSSSVFIPSPTRGEGRQPMAPDTMTTEGIGGAVVEELSTGAADSDRRRYDAPTRYSWAHHRPYQVDEDSSDSFDPVQRAQQRRGAWLRPLVIRSAAGDAIVTTGVVTGLSFSISSLRSTAPLVGLAAAAIWMVAVLLSRGYEARRLGDGPEEFQSLLRAALGVVAGLGVASYTFQMLLPRRLVLVAVPLVALLCLVNRHLARKELHRRRYTGQAMRRTLIVGEPAAVSDVVRDLAAVKHHGYDIIGACVPVPGPEIAESLELDVLGGVFEVPQVVVDHEVDSVIVVGAQLSGTPLRRLSWALEQTGADLVVAPGLVEVTGPNVTLRPSAGLSLLLVEPPSARAGRLLLKSVLDRMMGVAMLLVAGPVIAGAALLVKATSRGPAFFKQHRVGLDGREFTMYKLRSMVVDAEVIRDDLLEQTDRDGLMFKMRRDPRVTKVGAVLRRFSLDELPQLWNIVRGDMSVVGPRPPLPSEYEAYHDAVHRRLRVRPGLTGLWQVSGRADLSWEESVRLDLRYVDNWSIALDLQILWKTARAVVLGSGAY